MNSFNRLTELYEDWIFLIRQDGLAAALPIIATEISRIPYRHSIFFLIACPLDQPLPELQSKMQFRIRPLVETDLHLIKQINRPSEAKLCANRLALGQHGFIAMNHHQVAGYAWGYREIDARLERVPLRLKQGDILCNDAFTAPIYRGHGIQTALTLTRLHLFRELGYKRALCYIEKNNFPSLAVWQRKLNSAIIGQIDYKRIGFWRKVKYIGLNNVDTFYI